MKCTSPVEILNPKPQGTRFIRVPCGKCPACKQSRLAQWVFRLEQEYRVHLYACFLTLTYDDQNVPVLTESGEITNLSGLLRSCSCESFEMVLYKRHLQDFFRRIRKQGFHIKYYAIGEYSPKSRPHYHVILMSDDFNPLEVDFLNYWPHGFIKVGSVSTASIKYVCKHHLSPKNDGFFQLTNLHCEAMESDCLSSVTKLLPSLAVHVRLSFARMMEFTSPCQGITRKRCK